MKPNLSHLATTAAPGVVDTSFCSNTMNFVSDTGAPIKSYCLVKANKNFNDAGANCKSRGMSLFVPDPSYLQQPFLDTITPMLGRGPSPLISVFIGGPVSGQYCPTVTNINGAFLYSSSNCADLLYHACQFIPSGNSCSLFKVAKV